MAYLINRIYQTNQEVFGVDQKFELSNDVKKVKVSKFTGTQPGGTVRIDNRTYTNPSDTVNSYWATGGPDTVDFKFGIGGSDANYSDYWKKASSSRSTNHSSNTSSNNTSNNATPTANDDDDDEQDNDQANTTNNDD